MTFLTTLALSAVLLVIGPYFAHRLRRRTAEEQPFPPARLVEPTAPRARRRSRLEDRGLFATRVAAIIVLAVLGATPLVRCSKLSLRRSGGASVAMAIVMDDSMSMRAKPEGGESAFNRARRGALDLLGSAREGDAVAVVSAGAPARVALAATTDLGAARSTIESLAESDRATDLDGAVALAGSLLSSLPQIERRIVVLSDMADGRPDAPPLGDSSAVPIWVALPDLLARGSDCAVVRADRNGVRVRVRITCGPGGSAVGREVVVEDSRRVSLGHASPAAGSDVDLTVLLGSDDASPAMARLTGADAIASDDVAPVVPEAARGAIAVAADVATESVATGGAPIAEQALSALRLDVDVRPIPAFPDRAEDLAGALGVLLDDPPGLTPEQRRALATYLDGGGALLLALGPHCATAPLGASLEPVLSHAVAWSETNSPGADSASAFSELGQSVGSLIDLGASHRAALAQDDAAAFEPLVAWTDGAPLVARRAVGRGTAWIATLPVSLDASDLALRPAFLALLGVWGREAIDRGVAKRSDVGVTWTFLGSRSVDVRGPSGPIATTRDARGTHVVPSLLGLYQISVNGNVETRVASAVARELDLRARAVASKTSGEAFGERRASVDVSGQAALLLLALVAFEMALRMRLRRGKEQTAS